MKKIPTFCGMILITIFYFQFNIHNFTYAACNPGSHFNSIHWFVNQSTFNPSDVDLLVRTINVHGNSAPHLPIRIVGIGQLFHQEWNHDVGVIGIQEIKGEMTGCKVGRPNVRGPKCFANVLAQMFAVGTQSAYSDNDQVGAVTGRPWTIVGRKQWELNRERFNPTTWYGRRHLLELALEHASEPWRLRFYVTHFSYKRNLEHIKKRLKQAKFVTRKIRERAETGELPPILVGDFNAGRPSDGSSPEPSVVELEQYFYRPADVAYSGIDLIYVGKKSAFPKSNGGYTPLRTHDLKLRGICANVAGFPSFNDELTDHSWTRGLSFKIDWGTPQLSTNVKMSILDFEPATGSSYDLNWPGPPRRNLRYTDVKHYKPIIRINKPTAAKLTLGFWIKEERTAWWNPTLGSFTAIIPVGSKIPNEIITLNTGVGGRTPHGAPSRTNGTFWLGATKKGKIRGNEGKGDDRHARVYIEAFSYPLSVGGKKKSPERKVNSR